MSGHTTHYPPAWQVHSRTVIQKHAVCCLGACTGTRPFPDATTDAHLQSGLGDYT